MYPASYILLNARTRIAARRRAHAPASPSRCHSLCRSRPIRQRLSCHVCPAHLVRKSARTDGMTTANPSTDQKPQRQNTTRSLPRSTRAGPSRRLLFIGAHVVSFVSEWELTWLSRQYHAFRGGPPRAQADDSARPRQRLIIAALALASFLPSFALSVSTHSVRSRCSLVVLAVFPSSPRRPSSFRAPATLFLFPPPWTSLRSSPAASTLVSAASLRWTVS